MIDNNNAHDAANKSVVKAMALLTELGGHPDGATVTELAMRTRMSRPTAFRLLLSLAQAGFVEKADNHYRLGWKMARLGRLADPHRAVIAQIQPVIEKLAVELNEMVGYAVVNGGADFDLVAEALAPRLITLSQGYVGREFPIHASATGKVVLAELSDEEIRVLIPKKLTRMTERTITDRAVLLREVEQVRRQQHAIIDDELEESLFTLAVPVRSDNQRLIGVLSVTGPTPRMKGRKLDAMLAPLQRTAGTIADRLTDS